MKDKRKKKVIYCQQLAGYLMMNGFALVDMCPDNDGCGRNVFFFYESSRLLKAIDKYKAERNNKNP